MRRGGRQHLDGQWITIDWALIRTLAKVLSALIFLIGFIMAAFTERKQTLHDLIAGALMVTAGGALTVPGFRGRSVKERGNSE